MPNIKEYTTNVSVQGDISGRRATVRDFGGDGLIRVGAAATEAARDIARGNRFLRALEAKREVTDAGTEIARANADWTLHLRDRANEAQPGDPSFVPKFIEDFDNFRTKSSEKYKTRDGQAEFEKKTEALRLQLITEAGDLAAELEGAHAKSQFGASLDASSNVLVNDPLQFDSLFQSVKDDLNNPNSTYSNIPAAKRAPLVRLAEEQLSEAAVQGIINLDPVRALKELKNGKWDEHLGNGKRVSLESAAEQAIRAEEIEEGRILAAQEKARKEQERATQETIVQKLADNSLTTDFILQSNLPPVGQGSKEHYLDVLSRRNTENGEKPITTKPSVMLDLFTRVHLPVGDPRKITDEAQLNQAYIDGNLSFPDFQKLRGEVNESRTPEGEKLGKRKSAFISGISAQIDKSNPLLGKVDQTGKQQLYEFSFFVDRKVEEYKKEGKDPYNLFDPNKPDYLGSKSVLSGYQKTVQQSMQEVTKSIRGVPGNNAPRLPQGMIRPGNIDMSKRVRVDSKDGSFSTVVSKSFDVGGEEVLLPTLDPQGKKMTDKETLDRFFKTGDHLGIFDSPTAATNFAKSLSKGKEKTRRPGESIAQYRERTK